MKRTPRLQLPKDECPFAPDASDSEVSAPKKRDETEIEKAAGELIGRPLAICSALTRQRLDEAIEQCGEHLVLECLKEALALPVGRIDRTFRSALAKAKTRASRAGFDSAQAEPPQGQEQTVLNMTDEEIERMLDGGHKP